MHTIIQNAALAHQPDIYSISSGASSKGIDLGSSNFNVIKKPRVGVLAGDGISSSNFGEIWHFFEQQIDFPLSVFNTSDFRSLPLNDIDVLIMPNGSYGFLKTEVLPTAQIKKETGASLLIKSSPPPKLLKWINSGGRLIVIGSAMEKFIDQKGYGLVKYESESAKKEAKKLLEKVTLPSYRILRPGLLHVVKIFRLSKALSVEISTIVFTLFFKAALATFHVHMTLVLIPSIGLLSTNGTCFNAAE